MRIHLHTRIHNEEKILPYFIRHYKQFVDKMFFHDAYSTDKSEEIIRSTPGCYFIPVVNKFGGVPGSFGNIIEQNILYSKNKLWREFSSKENCDWVIACDTDEFLYCKNIVQVLEDLLKQGYQTVTTQGYQMISESFPTTAGQIYDEIKFGSPCSNYSKKIIFTPDTQMEYGNGSHFCTYPRSTKVATNPIFKLLHYSRVLMQPRVKLTGETGDVREAVLNLQYHWDFGWDNKVDALNDEKSYNIYLKK